MTHQFQDDEDCAAEGIYHVIVPRDASAERLALQSAIARAVSAAKRPLTLGVFCAVAVVGAEGLWGESDLWSGAQLDVFGTTVARMWTSVRAVREAEVLRENDPVRLVPLLGLKVSA